MDIKQELDQNQTVLLVLPSSKYNQISVDVTKKLSKESLCYVTLNKTRDALEETFKKKKINTENLVYIDAISKTIKSAPSQCDRCYYVSSPAALTELSLVTSKFLRHNFKYLIFDSLTNLVIYQKKAPVAKFLSSLINKIRSNKTKAVFYAVKVEGQEKLLQECSMFVDKVITLK
jgi:archaellum biogenesis ATPase FlaH